MLQRGEVLVTWQLLREPTGPQALPIPARRIGDHRMAYLDYEGPVSGDRGHVTQADEGESTIETLTEALCVVTLRGRRLVGRFRLILVPRSPESDDAGLWRLERDDPVD